MPPAPLATTVEQEIRLVANHVAGYQDQNMGTRTSNGEDGLAWGLQQCMTWCFITALFCTAAHAENPREQVCQRSGALASAVAQARDSGTSQTAAVTAVAATATPDEQAMVLEAAHLLYERFRQMTPDSAEFEFRLDCLDGAD